MYLVKEKSEWLACSTVPPPADDRVAEVGWLNEWLQDRTWISPTWFESADSPVILGVSSFRKKFPAMFCPLVSRCPGSPARRHERRGGRPRVLVGAVGLCRRRRQFGDEPQRSGQFLELEMRPQEHDRV